MKAVNLQTYDTPDRKVTEQAARLYCSGVSAEMIANASSLVS